MNYRIIIFLSDFVRLSFQNFVCLYSKNEKFSALNTLFSTYLSSIFLLQGSRIKANHPFCVHYIFDLLVAQIFFK